MTNPREHGFPSRARPSDRWGRTSKHSPSASARSPLSRLSPFSWQGRCCLQAGWRGPVAARKSGRHGIAVPEVAAIPAIDVPTDLKPRVAGANGLAVCVRLCDGFFFPSATSSGGDEACATQCPDAPTARYTEPVGSDRIEDAVSTHGALYTVLPVANRYRTTLDNTCSCHRSLTRGYSAAVLNDPTLRKGDVVVTPKGFLVFQGAKTRSITSSDFVALSQARSLPKDLRATLVDMERAGPSQRQVGVYSSPSASAGRSQALTPLAFAGSAR